jgi:hypothetical protein
VSLNELIMRQQFDIRLVKFSKEKHPLPGIRALDRRDCFAKQLVESVRRVKYVSVVRARPMSPLRADPASDLFDPIKGAIVYEQRGDIDEAFWLVFLSVHFGRARGTGWLRVRDIYGSLGEAARWTWARTSSNPQAFRQWLHSNMSKLKGGGRRFGNHRKYQSFDAWAPNGTGEAVKTYVDWVAPPRTHKGLVEEAQQASAGTPGSTFDHLYGSMRAVKSFGRMARFDYLTMLGKLRLADIEPASIYMDGATGPLDGARLLLGTSVGRAPSRAIAEGWLVQLGTYLDVGMQVLEDALCNWQKSPAIFIRFRG